MCLANRGRAGVRLTLGFGFGLGLGLGLGLEAVAKHRSRLSGDVTSLVRERKEGVYLPEGVLVR